MIDAELSRLTDDLKAAEAKLKGEDYAAQQSRLVAIEVEVEAASIEHEARRQQILAEFNATRERLTAEREALAESLENIEAAYENAKEAVTRHCAQYLEGATLHHSGEMQTDAEPATEAVLFGADPHFTVLDEEPADNDTEYGWCRRPLEVNN